MSTEDHSQANDPSASRHPDMAEYLHQARVVEVHRRVERSGVARLQMLHDDTCRGVPDPCRREQCLVTVDTFDVVDHPPLVQHDPFNSRGSQRSIA
jgi:hypothetical protein